RRAEGPWRNAIGGLDTIDKGAELRRRDVDDVPHDVRKPLTWRVPILCRREHRAEKEYESIGILVDRTDRLRNEIERIAADHRERAMSVENETVGTLDAHRELAAADVVDPEKIVEKTHERSDRARCVVVLRLAEQERAAPLEIAQIDIVAERRADSFASAVDGEHDLGLGIVPLRGGVNADVGTDAHRGHRLRLGEDLGIRPDADFEVLRPHTLRDQRVLEAYGFLRAGTHTRKIVTDERAARPAHRFGLRRIAARLLLDHPLQHARHERDAGGLDR